MEYIRFVNNNAVVCRSDMPNLSVGQPSLDDSSVERSLFELVSVKRWHNMLKFIDKWAPYGLPHYSDCSTLWDQPPLKRSGQRKLSGSVSRERKALLLGNADDLQPIIARYAEQLDFARSTGLLGRRSQTHDVISDEFDMRLKAVDERIDQSSTVIGIEEILAQRAMLILACRLYKAFLENDYSDELFARANLHVRGDSQIQVSFDCGELCENSWIRDNHCGKTLGEKPMSLFMGNMPVWEALSIEVDPFDDKAQRSFFVICPKSVTEGEEAMRYAAGAFAAALVNENAVYSKIERGGSYVDRDLRMVTDASLIWQMWNYLMKVFDARIPIGECANCRIPISAGGGREYCSDACKTAASKKRRNFAVKRAKAGKPLEDTVSMMGEKYRPNVERWYAEVALKADR